MLLQKAAKEFFILMDGQSLLVESTRRQLDTTIWGFDATLEALINGGLAPERLDKQSAMVVVVTPLPHVKVQLLQIQTGWRPLRDALQLALEENAWQRLSQETRKRVAHDSTQLLEAMDRATTMIGQVSREQIQFVHTGLTRSAIGSVVFAVSLLLFWVWRYVTLVGQLHRFGDHLVALEQGKLLYRSHGDTFVSELAFFGERINATSDAAASECGRSSF
ncbi:MAG: type IV pili methyl-accepting chemotaxis transducer N-terminal domain-containing protein [Magnetococcales bacterium]|nr:type IV pili methyl-accepting chemotaxis transducer N-terminal domain-containing protein [Magnetococcales bacterium]